MRLGSRFREWKVRMNVKSGGDGSSCRIRYLEGSDAGECVPELRAGEWSLVAPWFFGLKASELQNSRAWTTREGCSRGLLCLWLDDLYSFSCDNPWRPLCTH